MKKEGYYRQPEQYEILLIALVHSLDLPSLLCVLGIPLMILAASGKVGPFFKAFKKDGRIICILLPPFYGFIITAILLPIKFRLA